MILSHLDLATLLMLFNDKLWQRLIIKTFSKALNEMLRAFLPDASAFREVMRQTNTVISGPAGLWFLQRLPADWTPEDLDVITTNKCFDQVVDYLLGAGGCTLRERTRLLGGMHWNAFGGQVRLWTGRRHINILQSRTATALHTVAGYASTSLINALGADSFLTAYPSPTLCGRALVRVEPLQTLKEVQDQHKKMGVIAVARARDLANMRKGCRGSVLCGKTDRRVGDKECLMIQVGEGTPDALECFRKSEVTWTFGGLGCGNRQCFLPGDQSGYAHNVLQ